MMPGTIRECVADMLGISDHELCEIYQGTFDGVCIALVTPGIADS